LRPTKVFGAFFTILLSVGTTEGILMNKANAQWTRQNSGTGVELTDITISSGNPYIVCVGDSGVILKTTNGGQEWVCKHYGGPKWNAVAFAWDARTGIVVGDSNAVAVTSDSGETWTNWDIHGMRNLLSVAYRIGVSSRIFIGDDSGTVTYTINGGSTWSTLNFSGGPVTDIFWMGGFILTDLAYVVTPNMPHFTSDAGETWVDHPLPAGATALKGCFRYAGETVFMAGYLTIDSLRPAVWKRASVFGTSWESGVISPPSTGTILRDVSPPSNSVSYVCGSNGFIGKTSDDGVNWSALYSGTTAQLNAVYASNTQDVFVVGDSGLILHTSTGGTSVNRSGVMQTHYSLLQNYPNPFNPITIIPYELPSRSHARLAVYDILGREVSVLLDEFNEVGYHEVKFDATHFASGVYFYKLNAADFMETRKLVVIR
jgi:photosystem II stability/assembly factor-like uncharacterized protein